MSARRQTITHAEPSSNKTRVLIVDDHPMTRTGLAYLINHQPDMATCYEAQNAAEALEGVLRTTPDLVLTDFLSPIKTAWNSLKISGRFGRSPHPGYFDARRVALRGAGAASGSTRLYHQGRRRRKTDAGDTSRAKWDHLCQ